MTHLGNANANERVFTVLKDIFDVSGSNHNFKGITYEVYIRENMLLSRVI
jgi:hypothetical protein